MDGLFEVIIGAEDVDNHKPHPEPLQKAMEKLGVSPPETIYVGDSVHDIVAGRAAQLRTAAATWGPFPRIELESLQPDYLLDEPKELLTILD
jgi:pyrophosphatase PpaX